VANFLTRVVLAFCFILSSASFANAGNVENISLKQAIDYSLAHNPRIKAAEAGVKIEEQYVNSARSDEYPKIDLNGQALQTRYDSALTPLAGSPAAGAKFPDFSNPVYDAIATLAIPLYRGGRLDKNVSIAMLRKSAADELLKSGRAELVFNVTSAYYKIMQLQKLLKSASSNVERLEAHRKNAELFYKTGTAPKLDLLKTDVELANGRQIMMSVENALKSAEELLKTLMGMDDPVDTVRISGETGEPEKYPSVNDSIAMSLENRGELAAARMKTKIAEEKLDAAWGRRLPSLTIVADYGGRADKSMAFNENWDAALKMSVPLYDGGSISSEMARDRHEIEKSREEERAVRLAVIKEIKDSHFSIETSAKKIEAAKAAVDAAMEAERIENLKYKTGAGSNTDVMDAETALLRAESDYYQAFFDKDIAIAALFKAIGGSESIEGAK